MNTKRLHVHSVPLVGLSVATLLATGLMVSGITNRALYEPALHVGAGGRWGTAKITVGTTPSPVALPAPNHTTEETAPSATPTDTYRALTQLRAVPVKIVLDGVK